MKNYIRRRGLKLIMRLVRKLYFFFALIVGLLIVLKSVSYFHPDFSKGFLINKQSIFPVYKFFLYAHVIGAPLALLSGIFQFSFLKSRYHKTVGKIYVGSILFLAAPGGLYMSMYAIGGIPSTINFALMAILWVYFAYMAYVKIIAGYREAHRKYITRSFILTNSAVLIRLLSYLNNQFMIMDPTIGYIMIGWLSWLPWLLVYEVGLRFKPTTLGVT